MSTLRRQSPVGAGLRQIACTRVEGAIRLLTRQPGQASGSLGAVRAADAVLALIEPDLPRPITRRDRAIFARLSDGLGQMTAPAAMLAEIENRYKKPPTDNPALTAGVKSLRKRLTAQANPDLTLSSKAGSFNPAIYRLVADMAELRGHMGEWPTDAVADDAVPRGLRRQYTRARRLLTQPLTPDHTADLAACARLLELQLGVINKACAPMLKAQRKLIARAADDLEALGVARALDAALREQLGRQAGSSQSGKAALAEQAAAIIESELKPALAESPAAFINRVQVYWTAWRSA